MTIEKCGANGGTGIGAGHVCTCTGTKGHEPFYGRGHGCSCGAIWSDPAPATAVRTLVQFPRHPDDLAATRAGDAVGNAHPAILAAAKSLCAQENIPWGGISVKQQYTFCADATAALSAAYNVTFSPENLARVVSATGLSLQSVTEVARELRQA